MRLYHFTAAGTSHLGSILAEGQIRTTESNLSFDREHAGPPVVWLTSTPTPSASPDGTLIAGMDALKLTACLTVEIDDAHHWPEWARENGISESDYEALSDSGGDPDEWWVATRPIRRHSVTALSIREIESQDGEPLIGAQDFEGSELRRLFQSRGRQRALGLLETREALAPGTSR